MRVTPDEITTLAVSLGRLEQKVDDRDNKLDAIHRSLQGDIAGVEQRVTARVEAVDGKVDKVDGKVTETNGRVKKAELNDARLKGAFMVFAGASPFLVAALAVWLSHLFGG